MSKHEKHKTTSIIQATEVVPDLDEDEIVESEQAESSDSGIKIEDVLHVMGEMYRTDPDAAVKSQKFIKHLHGFIASQLEARLTKFALRRGIKIVLEPKILGSTKPKDVDVAVIDPQNGPLMIIGVRSQMSSIGNNVLTYYEGIVGEAISLQDRFPMSTHGYVYLHPLTSIKEGKEREAIDHKRYARMYAAITGRTGPDYKRLRGIYDEFAYLVVNFELAPPALHDDLVQAAVPQLDLQIATFVDRMVATFNSRTLFWDVFE